MQIPEDHEDILSFYCHVQFGCPSHFWKYYLNFKLKGVWLKLYWTGENRGRIRSAKKQKEKQSHQGGLTSPPGAGGQRLQRQHGSPAPAGLPAIGPVSTAVPVSPGPMPCGHRKLLGAHAAAICCPDKPALQPEGTDGESEEPGSPRLIPRSPQEPVPAGVKNPLREKPSRQIGNQKS